VRENCILFRLLVVFGPQVCNKSEDVYAIVNTCVMISNAEYIDVVNFGHITDVV